MQLTLHTAATEQKYTCNYFVVFGSDQLHMCVIYSSSDEHLHRCKMVLSEQFTKQVEHTSNPVNV